MIRLAHLVSHPIQYRSPLLRRIVAEPDIDLTVFYRSDFTVTGSVDPGFGVFVKWDTDLLGGHRHYFSSALGLRRKLQNGRFDAIWVHGYGSAYNLFAIGIARLMRLKVLLTDDVHLRSRVRGRLDEFKARAVFAYLRTCVDRFLAIGRANGDYYRHRGADEKCIVAMPYAVDNAFFAPKNASSRAGAKQKLLAILGSATPRSVVLFAAKLLKRKRCLDLVDAFSRLDRARIAPRPLLVVVGDGEQKAAVEAMIRARNLADDVKLLGFRNQSELPEIYQAADIFVLPADSEPWGLAINEAMSAGCAIVASQDIGAVADLVSDGDNGYLFPAGDIGALADKLTKALTDSNWLVEASRASRRIIANWDFEADVAGLRKALGLAEIKLND